MAHWSVELTFSSFAIKILEKLPPYGFFFFEIVFPIFFGGGDFFWELFFREYFFRENFFLEIFFWENFRKNIFWEHFCWEIFLRDIFFWDSFFQDVGLSVTPSQCHCVAGP